MRNRKAYVYTMKEEESDLALADFGRPGWPETAPAFDGAPEVQNAPVQVTGGVQVSWSARPDLNP